MDTMTWYHPLLTPGLAELTLICTVVSCERGPDRYENPYWDVRLRICFTRAQNQTNATRLP